MACGDIPFATGAIQQAEGLNNLRISTLLFPWGGSILSIHSFLPDYLEHVKNSPHG
jgi:hypothetical protein